MKYMGSKNRHYKEMLPIILQHRKPGQPYVEPMCGGCNMIYKVPPSFPRYANDSHPYLIALLKHVQAGGGLPDYISEEEYFTIRDNPGNYPDWYYGFVGFGCSYGGKWWASYARNFRKDGPQAHMNIGPSNYCQESKRNLQRQAPYLEGIVFTCGSYQDMFIPKKSLIYLDPPYKGTTGYDDKFDHEALYGWIIDRRAEGHTIFISEYEMPPEFKLIGGKRVVSSFHHSSERKTGVERLYTI